MAIIVDQTSRVLVQGITGREGAFHARRMLAAGTRIVAGVTPGKGGQSVAGVPVFDAVSEAVEAAGADTSVAFVPARFARNAALEAAAAGVGVLVLITEGIPFRDMVEVVATLEAGAAAPSREGDRPRAGTILVGPNCPGVVSPGACNAGIMAAEIFRGGPVGVVSRSGTLTYEIVYGLTRMGVGQSTCVGMGGDPVHGVGFVECLRRFQADEQTRAIVLVGEIGGDDEERAAEFIAAHVRKPVVAYIAGFTAPPGKRMGHAGAIVSGGAGTAAAKAAALEDVGVPVARRPDEVPGLVVTALRQR